MAEHGAYLAFDIYPSDDPRNGDLLARLTKDDLLSKTYYRHAMPTGSGRIHIHQDHAAAQYVVPGNYVRVVDLNLDEVIGGFWLEDGEHKVLSKDAQVGEQRELGGPSTSYYLHRGIFPYVLKSLADESLELHQSQIYETGSLTFTGESWGAILGRIIYEGRLDIPSALTAMPAHDWDDEDDSGGTPWPDYDGQYSIAYGDNLYDQATDIAQKGVEWWLDPHTFTPKAYVQGTYGTDRTSATFASGKVRFENGVNIAADLDKAIYRLPYLSHIMVIGDEPAAPVVAFDPGYSEVRWGALRIDNTHDPDILQAAGDEAIRNRKLQEDQARFPIRYGTDVGTGHYIPGPPGSGGHFWWGDTVTLHSGDGVDDYEEQPIRVTAIEWSMRSTGDFQVWVELGAQYVDPVTAAEVRSLSTIVESGACCPIPYCTVIGESPSTGDLLEGMALTVQFSAGQDPPSNGHLESVNDGDDLTSQGLTAPQVSARFWKIDWLNATDGLTSVPIISKVRIKQAANVGNTSNSYHLAWSDDDVSYTVAMSWSGDLDTGVVDITGGPYQHRYWMIYSTSGNNGWTVFTWELHGLGGGEIVTTDEYTGSARGVARCDHKHHWVDILDAPAIPDTDDFATDAEVAVAIAAALAGIDYENAGHWEPVANGDVGSPEMVFEAGDVVMEWVP